MLGIPLSAGEVIPVIMRINYGHSAILPHSFFDKSVVMMMTTGCHVSDGLPVAGLLARASVCAAGLKHIKKSDDERTVLQMNGEGFEKKQTKQQHD